MELQTQKLQNLLTTINDIPWNHFLYTRGKRPLTLNSECTVLDADDLKDSEKRVLKQREFVWTLLIQSVRDLVSNAKQQLPEIPNAKLVEALNFYLENDAFIEFDSKK